MYLTPTKIIMDDPPVFAKIEDGTLFVCGDPWSKAEIDEAGFALAEAAPEEIELLQEAGLSFTWDH